jgi:hypothetical protein
MKSIFYIHRISFDQNHLPHSERKKNKKDLHNLIKMILLGCLMYICATHWTLISL